MKHGEDDQRYVRFGSAVPSSLERMERSCGSSTSMHSAAITIVRRLSCRSSWVGAEWGLSIEVVSFAPFAFAVLLARRPFDRLRVQVLSMLAAVKGRCLGLSLSVGRARIMRSQTGEGGAILPQSRHRVLSLAGVFVMRGMCSREGLSLQSYVVCFRVLKHAMKPMFERRHLSAHGVGAWKLGVLGR